MIPNRTWKACHLFLGGGVYDKNLINRDYPMDALTFWRKYSKTYIEEMCLRAGTNYDYWKHICNKRKRPGVDLARKLVKESNGELSLDKLLFPKEEIRATGAQVAA